MREALGETMALVRAGVLGPATPTTSYPASQVETDFRRIQTGQHLGKLLLTFPTGDVVPLGRPELRLAASGTYLLVGDLGGLGRSMARLFVRLGARRLCFLSRSGAESSEARALVEELESHDGVGVLVSKGYVRGRCRRRGPGGGPGGAALHVDSGAHPGRRPGRHGAP